jgi:hypothetical protein
MPPYGNFTVISAAYKLEVKTRRQNRKRKNKDDVLEGTKVLLFF